MDNLWTYLLYGGLFFVMMRFGCGSHGSHGKKGHGSHADGGGGGGCCGDKSDKGKDKSNETDDKYIDPVCNMAVETEQGYGKMHQGLLYRFCSRKCLDEFEEEPDKFIKESVQ